MVDSFSGVAGVPSGRDAAGSRARRMLLSAQRLSGPARTLFDRVFIGGEEEATVAASMGLTEVQFADVQTGMLRTLAAVSQ